MKNVADAIERLASTSKRKEKEAILEEIKNSPLVDEFLRVAFLALDPRHNFNIVEYDTKELLNENSSDRRTLSEALDVLEQKVLAEGIRGNAAKDLLKELSASLDDDDKTILKNIIDRTLKCGVSDKTINKVWPGHIYVHPYRRCSSFNEKNIKNIKLPAYSQIKEDGMYMDIVVHDGKVEYRSRQGGYYMWNHSDNDDRLLKHAPEKVLMGEALVLDDNGEIMDRQTGNGYLNSDDVDPSRIVFSLWDIIDYEDWKATVSSQPYQKTFSDLEAVVGAMESNAFRVVETKLVNTIDEIIQHFKDMVGRGMEGTIVKNVDSVWKDGTSKDQVKIKPVFDVELEIVELKEGEVGKKYEGMLGAFVCKSSDGQLLTDVGSGLTDDQRKKFWELGDQCIGKIITVRACDIVKSPEHEHYALLHSRFIEARKDKTEADSFKRIVEQKEAAVNSLGIIES